ncbi:MAG: metallophosphoesterase [Desulfurivibrionaceae bacterium]
MKYAIIHIADIHYKREEPEGAAKIFNEFINDVTNEKEHLKDYELILSISGDIVYRGQEIECYTDFLIKYNNKLNKLTIHKNKRIIVPGNHDLDRNEIEKNYKTIHHTISSAIKDEPSFNSYAESIDARLFENYMIFESEYASYGLNFNHLGSGWKFNDDIGVYCINSALASFGGYNKIDDRSNLAVYTRGVVDWLEKSDTKFNILLMHHPLYFLSKWCKDELTSIIENNFDLCLSGHVHEQNVFYNKISNKSLCCSAPGLFTAKTDKLGYSIICINNSVVEKIIYKQYVDGKFLNGQAFTGNNEGIINIKNIYSKSLDLLTKNLEIALAYFKGQSGYFVKPKLSETREFNKKDNLLDGIIANPTSSVIVAQPQFGLTCLSHHMRLEAFKNDNFWIYIDAKYVKTKKINDEIDSQLNQFEKSIKDIKCIIIDSWDDSYIDHKNMLTKIDSEYENIPVLVMSNYSEQNFKNIFDFNKLNTKYIFLHLQALEKSKVRELVESYNQKQDIANDDLVVSKVVKDLEALNIHRTPLNCITLLKVFERDFNSNIVNRTKMIKAVLFILFTDSDSFTYSSSKPDVSECEYILGRFCKELIEKRNRYFARIDIYKKLNIYCKDKLFSVDVSLLIDILESNNILININDTLEFKHTFWLYYFASSYMMQDDNFKSYILENKNYVNYPEIIEFYTGQDSNREDAIVTLTNDLDEIITAVCNNIGITGKFNPLENFVWSPSPEAIESIRKDISEKVKESKLPNSIKDQHSDLSYNSEAPYNQDINQFFEDYSVLSLLQAITASSRALRNSNFVDAGLRRKMIKYILEGWEQISKVIFLISPTLAKEGRAFCEGLGVTLLECDFNGNSTQEKLKAIYLANPYNVVLQLKDNLSSKKIGPLIFDILNSDVTPFQKLLISRFLISEKPDGWHKTLYGFVNLLHRNSFLLGDIHRAIQFELEHGYLGDDDTPKLKSLMSIVLAKHKYFTKKPKSQRIMHVDLINEKNKLPIDKIRAEECEVVVKKSKSH